MGGFLQAMKHDTYSEYDPRNVSLLERAFLTVWGGLGAWHEDLVLVGGLVPNYLCGDVSADRALPRPVTLDADLGISLGAESRYGNLQLDLQGQGFRRTTGQHGETRFVKTIGNIKIPVDFLTETPPAVTGVATVDGIPASILPGINRALETARSLPVEGIDLLGARQRLLVHVCEVGPFLMMKLRAFKFRQQPKDAFDILYTILHYDRGTDAAISDFQEEISAENPAMNDALACLKESFDDERSLGPVKAAHFIFGQVNPNESKDTRFRRQQIQQDMVTAGKMLKSVF